jgi:hypothetical protein
MPDRNLQLDRPYYITFAAISFRPLRQREIVLEVSLRSPSGGVRLRVTERGLPMALEIEQPELSKAPTQLAHEILLLCQLGARRAQVARRRDLVARGATPAVIRGLNLSTEEDLANAEAELYGEDGDVPPGSWMEPV